MLYLIGGAPRAGKSQLAGKLIAEKPMLSMSCDFLYDLDQVKALPNFEEAGILEKGRAFYPVLKQLMVNISLRAEDCVIEGEVILPEHISELSSMYHVRSCFLGLSHTSLDTIIANGGFFNWPKYKLDYDREKEDHDLAERTIARSSIIQQQCSVYSLPYYDSARNYPGTIQKVIEYLLS